MLWVKKSGSRLDTTKSMKEEEIWNMYAMYVDGNTMKRKGIRKAVLRQVQNGKMYQMILSAHYVL